jgi:hypothetical protein
MLWPAAKLGDMVIGIDIHTVVIPPAPPAPLPHPYFGVLYLWLTPQFPSMNVFINGLPACSVGAMGYSAHIPMGIPVPPSMLNLGYFTRHLLNVPKQLLLIALTMAANSAISLISSVFFPPNSATGRFVKDVTGVDLSTEGGITAGIKGGLKSYTKWQTWAKLLIPPLPFPGAHGSSAIGTPTVQCNGGPLGFVAPLMSISCTDFVWVPNAMTIGFTNVFVGVSLEAMARALVVHAAQVGVQKGVAKGVDKASAGKNHP